MDFIYDCVIFTWTMCTDKEEEEERERERD